MISHQTNSKNLEQYVVGLTGNICSGKSKAAEYFKELGAEVIDLDGVVHELYQKNILLKYKLFKEFGWVFNKRLEVDRKKLGNIVFSNESKLKKLETIVWPYVEKEREKKTKNKKGIIMIEAAKLYESGVYKKFDMNILVIADEEERIKRLLKRDGLERKEALKRIKAQMPQLEKIGKSDYVIPNNGDLKSLKKNVKDAWVFLHKKYLFTLG